MIFPIAIVVAGCAALPQNTNTALQPTDGLNPDLIRPTARPTTLDTTPAPPPPANARTVEQFDTTSAEDRAAAVDTDAVADATEKILGNTIASLGDPIKPGFWLETPLVSTASKGKLIYPETGKEVLVDLMPIDGAASAGSRISLAAIRLLGAPLTSLPEIQVVQIRG